MVPRLKEFNDYEYLKLSAEETIFFHLAVVFLRKTINN